MRNLKRVLALAMALVLTLGMMVIGANAASYTDANAIDAKYAEAIDVLTGMGVFQGMETGAFAPKEILNRAQASALVYRVLTGDVTDAKKVLYDYTSFDDVKEGAWYTGYVTYAANGGYIKGYGDGTFGPYDKVTGVQVLAIMLRAIGYGQKGEFEGAAWKDNTLTTAQDLGLLTGIANVNDLDKGASRELVAQLLFNALTVPYMVQWSTAFGYQPVKLPATVDEGKLLGIAGTSFVTLGTKVFGLTNVTGIVVGNQATGEKTTKIAYTSAGASYVYTDAEEFDINTGLDMFGHATKVWFDARTLTAATGATVYASYDKATKTAVVEATDASLATNGKLLAAAKTAGFSPLTTAARWSDAYGVINPVAAAAPNAPAASNLYVLVSNNAVGTVDVVVKVDAEVAKIARVDTTAASKTLTLNGSSYGRYGTIPMDSLTSGSTTTLGSIVIAQKINGTAANTKLPFYDLDAVTKTVTGTVVAIDNATGKIVLSDGTSIEKSPLYNVVKGNCIEQPATWSNATYVITLDNNGKYLGAKLYNDKSFIYGTFADYASAGTNTGTVNYFLTGVTLDGQIVTKDITKAINNDWDTYLDLTVAQKTWSYDNIETGTHTGYAIDGAGRLTTDTTVAGVQKMNFNWTITKADVAKGYVANADADTFFTNATKFIVVSGTGTDTLSVQTFNGISELLGNADSVTLDAFVEYPGDGNIYYTSSNYIYNNVDSETKHIDTVILGADDLDYVTTSTVYYCYEVKAGLTSTVTIGGQLTTATQYTLYKGGEAAPYYIVGAAPKYDTFYTLIDTGVTVSGAPVYTLGAGTGLGGNYRYVGATNNLDTALIYTPSGNVLKTVTGAKVVNLVDPDMALGSIAELNNAVSVGYNVAVRCETNPAGAVTVMYVISCGYAVN